LQLDTEKKRKSYSKIVREVNQYKVEEHKRIQNNGGQQRNRTNVVPLPKHRRVRFIHYYFDIKNEFFCFYFSSQPDALRSHFLSPQEVRDFERRIKREHDANCKCSLHANSQNSSA
jgi:hypothetical protein